MQDGSEHRYDDMIGRVHPDSARHPRMSMHERAAQFSPFAALTGYSSIIRETARQTERRIELDEYEKAALDEKMHLIQENISRICVTYFVPDGRKEGGAYMQADGLVKRVDAYARELVLESGIRIPVREIVEMEVWQKG